MRILVTGASSPLAAGVLRQLLLNSDWELWCSRHRKEIQIVDAGRRNGLRRFVYVSTRCATRGSGAYGESKLAAEQALQKLDWKSLLIIRPAEIYGGGGNEGIDRMLAVARRWRIIPALFGHANLRFAPMHVDDFSRLTAELIQQHHEGVTIENVCGPEDLNGISLAYRISKRYGAIPLLLWWP